MKNRLTVFVVVLLGMLSLQTEANPQRAVSPAKGDSVTFRVTQGKDAKLVHDLKQEILNENGNRTLFDVRFTLTAPGQAPEVTQEQVSADALVNSEIVESILKNCKDLDGKTEKLQIAGKSIETCKFSYSEEGLVQATWFAAVPFGIARTYEETSTILEDGAAATEIEVMELTAWTFGRP